MKLATNKGYKDIVIFGESDYYPRIGFKTCDNFNITTADGKNYDAFMGIEYNIFGRNVIFFYDNILCTRRWYFVFSIWRKRN